MSDSSISRSSFEATVIASVLLLSLRSLGKQDIMQVVDMGIMSATGGRFGLISIAVKAKEA